VQRLVEVEHGLQAAVVLGREGAPLLAGALGEDLLDRSVRVAPRAGDLVLDEVLAPDPATPRLPELRLQRAEGHPAVGAAVWAIADDRAGELEAAAVRRHVLGEVPGGDHRQPRQRAVGHRDVDDLALARAVALAQRGEDREGGHHGAAAEVGDLAGRLDRRPVGVTGEPEQPDEPEVVHVVARAVAVGPVLPVAGDRAVDDAGVDLAHRLVADAEAVEDTGAKRLEHDVGFAHRAQERLAPHVALEVQANRALAAVQRQEERGLRRVLDAVVERRPGAQVVAHSRVLDLDHVGAEVGEQQRAEAAGEQAAEVEDADAFERELRHAAARLDTPSISRACATVAGVRPTSSVRLRALAIRSPLERAIVPSGR
jgi:hypothetical protein